MCFVGWGLVEVEIVFGLALYFLDLVVVLFPPPSGWNNYIVVGFI